MNNIKGIGLVSAVGVRAVLAGAYLGRRRGGDGSMLLHAVAVDCVGEEIGVLCGRIPLESLCDLAESGPPTCPTCARRAAK
jgi:hypothetical protein